MTTLGVISGQHSVANDDCSRHTEVPMNNAQIHHVPGITRIYPFYNSTLKNMCWDLHLENVDSGKFKPRKSNITKEVWLSVAVFWHGVPALLVISLSVCHPSVLLCPNLASRLSRSLVDTHLAHGNQTRSRWKDWLICAYSPSQSVNSTHYVN